MSRRGGWLMGSVMRGRVRLARFGRLSCRRAKLYRSFRGDRWI